DVSVAHNSGWLRGSEAPPRASPDMVAVPTAAPGALAGIEIAVVAGQSSLGLLLGGFLVESVGNPRVTDNGFPGVDRAVLVVPLALITGVAADLTKGFLLGLHTA